MTRLEIVLGGIIKDPLKSIFYSQLQFKESVFSLKHYGNTVDYF